MYGMPYSSRYRAIVASRSSNIQHPRQLYVVFDASQWVARRKHAEGAGLLVQRLKDASVAEIVRSTASLPLSVEGVHHWVSVHHMPRPNDGRLRQTVEAKP